MEFVRYSVSSGANRWIDSCYPRIFFSWSKETLKSSLFLCFEFTALLRIMTNIFGEGAEELCVLFI